MRLAYLSGSTLPSPFANSVHVVKMCRAFAGAGFTVTLYANAGLSDGTDPLTAYGVSASFQLSLFPPRGGRGVRSAVFALAVRRHLQRARPDLIYARHLWSLLAAASLGVPFVYEAHALPPNRTHRAAEAWLLRHVGFRRLVVISKALRDDYLAVFPWLDPCAVVVAHDGADAVCALAHEGDASDSTSRFAIGATNWPCATGSTRPKHRRDNCLQIGYVGHLYPGKGMEIVAALAPLLPQMDFHVIGGLPADQQRWQAIATHENLHYHGFVPHAELAAWYDMLDVVLVPVQRRVALQDGKGEIGRWTSPLKLFEAMAFGKALIVSDHPTLLEVVTHETTALVAPASDATAWAAALRRLEAEPETRHKLGDAARHLLETQYTWQVRAGHVVHGLAA